MCINVDKLISDQIDIALTYKKNYVLPLNTDKRMHIYGPFRYTGNPGFNRKKGSILKILSQKLSFNHNLLQNSKLLHFSKCIYSIYYKK